MIFKINGVDCLPFVDDEGFVWTRNDIEASSAGRTTMDGTMHRARIVIKKKLEISCKPLTTEQSNLLLNLIAPEFVEVTYTDPMEGVVTKSMYSNNVPATAMSLDSAGNPVWKGISFPLVER